jgi:hypothetical protein
MVSARPLAANSPAAGQLFRYLRRGRRFARAARGLRRWLSLANGPGVVTHQELARGRA